jgi:putative ABC transport system permease protein
VDRRVTLSFSAPRARYRDAEKIAALAERVRDEVSRMPEVVAAGAAQALPFAENATWFQALTRENPRGVSNVASLPHVHYNVVTTGYAEALGLPLRAGRTFSTSDASNTEPVVVINQALANQHFRGENPIGQKIWIGDAQALVGIPPRTIVGVVGDALWRNLERPAEPEAWVPVAQQTMAEDVFRTQFLVFETRGDPSSRMAEVRSQIKTVDKDLALTSIRTLQSRVSESVWRQRLVATTLGGLSLTALVIALLGVFGVISYLVTRRTHEMGVRIALGARPQEIMCLVLKEGGALVLTGVALGAVGAYGLTRYLSTLLYGVTSTDAVTFAGSALLLGLAAMLACCLPARRAARVDPMVTLRAD